MRCTCTVQVQLQYKYMYMYMSIALDYKQLIITSLQVYLHIDYNNEVFILTLKSMPSTCCSHVVYSTCTQQVHVHVYYV